MDNIWTSPDGKIRKEILRQGEFGNKPSEGSQCTVNIKENSSLEDLNRTIVIGDSDGELWRSIDICLTTMFVGEQSKFHITSGETTVYFILELVSLIFNGFIYEWNGQKLFNYAVKHKEKGVELFRLKNNKDAAYRFIRGLKIICCIPIDVENTPESIDNLLVCDIIHLKAQLYNNLASCYLKNEIWDKVIQFCNKVVSLEADNVKALYKLGVAFEKERNFEKAFDAFNKVIDLEPENKSSAEHLIFVRNELKKADIKVNHMMKKMFVGLLD